MPKAMSLNKSSRLPGDSGVWVFIFADMMAFAIFFLVMVDGRIRDPEIYEQSRQTLNVNIGFINTLILLTSSMFMALAVEASRKKNRKQTVRFLISTIVVGLGFGVLKIYEYVGKFSQGIGLNTNDFYSYYFAFTGVHFLHYIIGMVILAWFAKHALREDLNEKFNIWIESAGIYWHMVDLLWIVLFPLIYLMRLA